MRTTAGQSAAPQVPAGDGAPPALVATVRRITGGRMGDALLVAVFVALDLGHTAWGGEGNQSAASWLLAATLPLPLLVRRSRPLAAFSAIAALALLEWIVGTPTDGNPALLFGLYAVGVYCSSWRAVAAAAVVAQVGVVLAATRWAPSGQTLTATLLLTGTVTAAWVLGVYVRTRRAYVASVLERARTAERDRDRQALLAAAQERTRIARELHDIVAHSVSVMVALSDGAAATMDRNPAAARDASTQASATGRQALTEMHRLLGVLRDGTEAELAPQPGLAQIAELLEPIRAAGVQVDLVENGPPAALPASAELAVYRLVQESLTNVLKHGRAVSRVTVTLRYRDAAVDIEIDDDGHPKPQQFPPSSTGHGLIGMRERLAAFDGQLHAGATGSGWRVHGHLPLQARPGTEPETAPVTRTATS